jgi:hypothetical protein
LPIGPSWWQRYGWWIALLALLIIGFPAVLKSCTTDFPLYKVPKAECSPSKASCESSPPAQAPAPAPVLDKKALENNKLDAFTGKWRLITGLSDTKFNKPIGITFVFKKDGSGSSELTGAGFKCNGIASAQIKSGEKFDINVPSMSPGECAGTMGGFTISKDHLVQCTLKKNEINQADCTLICAGGMCNATFQRD